MTGPNTIMTNYVVVKKMPQCSKDGIDLRDAVGIIPMFIQDPDKPMIDTLTAGYGFGWRHMDGFVLDRNDMSITYMPGSEDSDPPLHPWAMIEPLSDTNEDRAYVYQFSWVLVLRSDDTFEVSRMD